MERHLDDPGVECLVFDYLHFYGNRNTYAWSLAWYRRAPRIIRNTIPVWAPKGLFFIVLEDQKRGRYPRAAHSGATIYHYGWARPQGEIQTTKDHIEKYWRDDVPPVRLAEIDPRVLRLFTGTHPAAIRDWLPPGEGLFQANPDHRLTARERKHRLLMTVERLFGVELSKKHFTLVRPRAAGPAAYAGG
jgi:hypothetical protein